MSRFKAVSSVILLMMGCSVIFCMGNASHIIDALAPMVLGINMLIAGILLIVAFVYRQPLQPDEHMWNSKEAKSFFVFSLRYFAPVILSIILLANLWQEAHHMNLAVAVRWGWLLAATGASFFIVQYTSRAARRVTASTFIISPSS